MNKNLAVMLAVVAVATFGCGKSPESKVTVSEQGKSTTYEVNTKEGKTKLVGSDTQVSIPDTFPKDVPILKGAVPKLSMSQGKTEVLHLLVPGGVGETAKDYQEKLKEAGWEIESSMNMGDTSMVQGKKGTRTCAAVVVKDDKGSLIQLSVAEK